ncbi:hypothetical protein GQ53DRAFT_643366 [Thozetella sp. PMI_491]|nr:hypothetical protein GQ53DRAFT_643366 [Thozetella sp. PMI_491]
MQQHTDRPLGPVSLARSLGSRSARSRQGCLTCKRRKVKCDEQRPRCSHCERLNMECKWRPASTFGAQMRANGASDQATMRSPPMTDPSPSAAAFQSLNAVTQVFDYASFMWDAGDAWQQVTPDEGYPLSLDVRPEPSEPSTVPDTSSQPDQTMILQVPAENHRLMDYFTHAVTPPILAEVETHKKWVSMRQILVGMASASRMVRLAILAFSNLMLVRREGPELASHQNHYSDALSEAIASESDPTPLAKASRHRQNLLATFFFLSYVDILEGRIEAAHSNLKRSYDVFQKGEKDSFNSVEKQFILWLRLLDARAVSAGGEGLFLSEADEDLLVETTPATLEGEMPPDASYPEGDIEDVLFQVLYQPGIVFFQKVQSFMGRISQIDPWHRSRGTVEDETEVMNIGAAIADDLRSLYKTRPLLMDFAVTGKLTSPHISAYLGFALTRAFRTYLSNYYASKVHLHRVAYKTLPLTREALEALGEIRSLARMLAEGLDSESEEALPVNMLWPLLMLGSEEQDPDERQWIKSQILRMEKVAGNAKITAQVLQEVQTRQDASKTRVDIRSVMHDIFNSCFAIV